MKGFFKRYSYSCVKLMVTQFAIGLYGGGLALATAANGTLLLITSLSAILFYLFLVYISVWEIGAKDRLSAKVGRLNYSLRTSLSIALFANIINIIIFVAMTVGLSLGDTLRGAALLGSIGRIIALFMQGMYFGVTALIKVGGTELHNHWWVYLISMLPLFFVVVGAYKLGFNEIRVTNLMVVSNPEERRKKSKFFDGIEATREDKKEDENDDEIH